MKISVIIPAYNCADYIAQTLNCIYAQTMPRRDIEIIVCMDAPTDNTADVVRAWVRAHRGANVVIIENKTNMGVSKTRNAAIARATGEFLHFMDSDDLINADFYSAMYSAATRAASDVAACSFVHQRRPDCSVVFDNSIVLSNPQDKIDEIQVDAQGFVTRYLVRRDFWRRQKFSFPVDMRFGEDWLLANKIVYYANAVVTVPDARYLYKYRQNSLMMQLGENAEYMRQSNIAANDVREFMAAHNLAPHQRAMSVRDWRMFGCVRIVTVTRDVSHVRIRLFGKWTLFRVTINRKFIRGNA